MTQPALLSCAPASRRRRSRDARQNPRARRRDKRGRKSRTEEQQRQRQHQQRRRSSSTSHNIGLTYPQTPAGAATFSSPTQAARSDPASRRPGQQHQMRTADSPSRARDAFAQRAAAPQPLPPPLHAAAAAAAARPLDASVRPTLSPKQRGGTDSAPPAQPGHPTPISASASATAAARGRRRRHSPPSGRLGSPTLSPKQRAVQRVPPTPPSLVKLEHPTPASNAY